MHEDGEECGGTAAGALLTPGGDFTVGELSAMALSGELVAVYGLAFRPASLPETAAVRAAALAAALPAHLAQRAALSGLTAAWVYGCAAEPAPLSLSISSLRRSTKLPPRSGCVLHEVHLPAVDTVRLGGARVTTALRTAVDAALWEPAVVAGPVLRALADRPEADCRLPDVLAALQAAVHVPGRRRGEALLRELLG